MKKITKAILAITACLTALAAASCTKDNTIRYNNATMGNIVNGTFTSDQGNIFTIVDQTCPGKLDTMKRAFVICDILTQKTGTENEYEVRMNYISPVLTKDAIFTSSISQELANDPIILQSYWVSGGYINIYFAVPVVADSKIKHYINFEYDDTASKEGTYTFHIRHDSNGEEFNESNESKIQLAYAYSSVPVASIIKENDAKIVIEWLSHKIMGNTISLKETTEVKREVTYSKEAYQQTPAEAIATRSTYEIR